MNFRLVYSSSSFFYLRNHNKIMLHARVQCARLMDEQNVSAAEVPSEDEK